MVRTFFIAAGVSVAALAPSWAQDLPGMAAGILEQSKLGRQAVAQHDSAAALDHIRQGKILANEILRAAPPEPRPVLVQVYKDIDTTATYAPVKRRKTDLLTTDRLKRDTSVRDVEGNITVAKLDVNSADGHLDAAQQAVERQDWVTAGAELGAIPASIIRTSVEGTMPLLEARQNLELARMRVMEGKFKDARVPLDVAAQDLGKYEQMVSAGRLQEVENIRQQIQNYTREIAHQHENATTYIDSWLTPVNKWNSEASR
ncbi:MAG: hypothetical protein JOZ22_06985 [Acidobacteriia bacterium]|nr:hypothetical protein [Terriglobia bacterium]